MKSFSTATGLNSLLFPLSITIHRKQRLAELQKQHQIRPGFGEVIEISRPDFTTEVTEASKEAFVVVHLYQSGLAPCQLVTQALRNLCGRYPKIKFVEIMSTRCIEKYPDALVPTILVYKDTNVFSQVTKATPEQVKRILDTIQEELDKQDE